MKQEERLIPYKRIRRFLRHEVKGIVSKEACEFMQNYLENYLREICKDVITQHQEQNKLRKHHGLHELKRFEASEFKCLLEMQYKTLVCLLHKGEEAQHSRDTSLSDKQE